MNPPDRHIVEGKTAIKINGGFKLLNRVPLLADDECDIEVRGNG